MSSVFQQVMYELGIHQYKSSAYHPENQAIERFHQTLKNMLKHIVIKQVKNGMKEFIFYCLPLETLFKYVLGSVLLIWFKDSVRGPLKLYKEKSLPEDDFSFNILSYVYNFKHKLPEACELAQNKIGSVQAKKKEIYVRYAQFRSFQPGDNFLALLPVPGTFAS